MNRTYMDNYEKRADVERIYEYRKWGSEIPYLEFPDSVLVKPIPPFGGAVARLNVQSKYNDKTYVSIYLDCYDALGCVGEPYWEVYPYPLKDDDTGEEYEDCYRCLMNEGEELVKAVMKSIKYQLEERKENDGSV